MQVQPALPGPAVLWLAAAAGGVAWVCWTRASHEFTGIPAALALGFSVGFINAALQAQYRLDNALADAHQDEVSRLVLRVAGLPDGDAQRQRFVAELDEPARPGIPTRIQVTWQAAAGAHQGLPQVLPGQVWRMALVLRRPQGLLNPAGPDAQGRMFADNVRATGTVRGQPDLLADRPWATPGIAIERARHHVREGMRAALGPQRYAPVLVALAIGDQAGVARDDWRIFNRSGITHLVSISGMHVTSIAGIAGLLASAIWRRLRWRGAGLAERLPARIAGGAVAAAVALLYCLLAGWGVPARRTFFMLSVVLAAVMSRLPLSAGRVLACAAAVVVALDPWAPVSPGFWLSFGAVAVLLRIADAPFDASAGWRERWLARLAQATRLQLMVTVGLMPLLAFLVHQVSLGSPLANAVAIPSVTFIVTPLALLCAALSAVPGAEGAAAIAGRIGLAAFDLTMAPVAWVGNASWASVPVAAAGWPWLLLAVAGMVWALQARGWPGRHLGWACMLPLLFWRPDRPEPGYWRMSAMDVGQGSSILVETASQSLLFDAGPRSYGGSDAGERVVAPFLQARGIGRLDVLVLSHADTDHVGGTRAVLAAAPVARSHAAFDLPAFLRRDARMWPDAGNAQPVLPQEMKRCERGWSWEADGVSFTFLHPAPGGSPRGEDRNADSCVLRVEGLRHSLLLTGDIGVAQERELVAEGLAPTDVVLAPHHGSASSSGRELVAAVGAAHAIAQAGHLNRFRHPARAVELRWTRAGTRFWRSDRDGAVMAESGPGGLDVWAQRDRGRRYWHER
ncbi:DNA internalization-related competence protein ComEC/Rec2 [Achromobacter deleyi]|uniref:DNA internalization-related competence protein ComEC/Rec2 n=1 Tax=Achromobacter deleyi TaxID=1353891 RepID=UPI001490FA4E|nr:DNA internalization-related competence protein ComEC/Rec2 [Achromobacter deleyi]QVQ27626.1 DNA internalization-related competence protein ComEC/Rec2 [Achromobacter deleyi]UIP23224.1 DNA internalization-related competence protein ComEC/Rec2 [Achromobacter deleyi]